MLVRHICVNYRGRPPTGHKAQPDAGTPKEYWDRWAFASVGFSQMENAKPRPYGLFLVATEARFIERLAGLRQFERKGCLDPSPGWPQWKH